MRTIILSLILTLFFGVALKAEAQKDGTIQVRANQQRTHSKSKLKIRFLSLAEDSRCPEGTNCIWAGNARIKVKISDAEGRSQVFEMNTNLGPKGASFGSYTINLIGLSPAPKADGKISADSYVAVFEISKLTR